MQLSRSNAAIRFRSQAGVQLYATISHAAPPYLPSPFAPSPPCPPSPTHRPPRWPLASLCCLLFEIRAEAAGHLSAAGLRGRLGGGRSKPPTSGLARSGVGRRRRPELGRRGSGDFTRLEVAGGLRQHHQQQQQDLLHHFDPDLLVCPSSVSPPINGL